MARIDPSRDWLSKWARSLVHLAAESKHTSIQEKDDDMRFGAIARIDQSGPHFTPDALKTIGVSNGSQCWGVWLPPSDLTETEARERSEHEISKDPHLLIASINPESWPYVFRLQLRLAQRVGALCDATEAFNRLQVNILSARCTESGHRHATWNIVGEAFKIKTEMRELEHKVKGLVDPREKKRAAAAITERLIAFLPFLVGEIEKADAAADKKFLHERFKTKRLSSFEQRFFENRELWKNNENHVSKPVGFTVMPNLTHFWRHARNLDEPLMFKYEAASEQLKPENEKIFTGALSQNRFQLPTGAIGSFDTDEHYVRIDIFKRNRAARTLVLDVGYEKTLHDSDNYEKGTSIGLLGSTARAISERDVNLLHARNVITYQTRSREIGTFTFAGATNPKSTDSIEEQHSAIRSAIKSMSNEDLKIKCTSIRHLSIEKIFLSMHLEANRAGTIRKIIEERSARAGFEAVTADTSHRRVTEEVIKKMCSCVGFIQVLTPRQDDQKEGTEDSDIDWLVAEYFGALTLRLEPLRFADETVMSESKWRSKIDPDRPLHMFSSRRSDRQLSEEIAPLIDRFLAQLHPES
ncbi:MAG: hypothetical protein GY719_04730 [bacterium]|nr:hypothetical protein [bacterium]